MPLLVCSAMTCVYNKNEYCSKGDIMVGGKDAETSGQTFCESFVARKGNAAVNSAEIPSETIHVDCKACHCQYNEAEKCAASKIDINGASASTSDQTECGTFHCQCHSR